MRDGREELKKKLVKVTDRRMSTVKMGIRAAYGLHLGLGVVMELK